MSLGYLKAARLIVPAVLIILFAAFLGWFTGLWSTTIPDFSKSQYLPIVMVPAALYYITPLRRWINAPHVAEVDERLRAGLVAIAGYPDKPDKYTWDNLRPLFYGLVDEDKSLEQKAELARSNGVIWTSFADATGLAFLFFIASMAFYYLGLQAGFLAGMAFLLITAVGVMGSLACTRKQIEIGAEQLKVIEYKHKSEVEDRLNSLD